MPDRGNVVLAALSVLLGLSLVAGQGRFFWIGAAAVVAAAAVLAAGLLGELPRPELTRAGLVCVLLLCAFALWSGASILWSEAPDRSWDFFNRALVYLAFLCLGLFASRRPFPGVLAGLLGLVLAWALLEKVFALSDGRRARLNEPVGYWNTLGLLAAVAVPLALRLGSRRRGALLLYGAVVVVLLTQSRGALLLGALAAAVWLWLESDRYEGALRLAVAVPVGVVVGVVGLALDGVSEDAASDSLQLRHGLWLGLALVLGAGAVVALARVEVPRRALRAAAWVVVPAAAVALSFLGVRAVLDFSEPVTPESSTRFLEASGNNRAQWWEEAARGFADNPFAGNGAGAFQVTHRRYRESNVEVREPHSLPLQLLSETGLVGFTLFFCAAVAAAFGVRRERSLVLVVALFALGVLFDIHWDFAAAGAVAFATLGVLLPRGERMGSRQGIWAAGVVALALGGVYSLGAPWLAERRVDEAFAAIERGELGAAAEHARAARGLDPTSVEPLFALGYVFDAQGDFFRAREQYARAVEIQPANREAWFLIGRLEYEVDRYQDAYIRFNRMYELDPHGPHVLWVRRAQCELDRSVSCPPPP